MAYTLSRGTVLLGRVEARRSDATSIYGFLIPQDADVELRSESQMHLAAFRVPEASVVTMPEEPTIADAPRRQNSGGGSFSLNPVIDDNTVKPSDELHLRDDDRELRLRTISLRETRYLGDVPADEQRGLPAGALRGRSYWTVMASIDTGGDESSSGELPFDDVPGDEISP